MSRSKQHKPEHKRETAEDGDNSGRSLCVRHRGHDINGCDLPDGILTVDGCGAVQFAGERYAMNTTSEVTNRGRCKSERCQLDNKDFFAEFNDRKWTVE